ncbi:group II intron reverse transcriptase/maturase [Dechloromonas denitrificans]|uniref:group II intron reverse transcriptase/maturase n=1 Tax=Dechloromonas denitrificans TaxID=281362 RepID=UPI001CF928D5|nr:group II intron reverse transcriptase/maturase [Dechloromonas denitrificans]UCV04944.1 group II intron reverse transcriptase/maturase [Dechloromonas denitrificans]
MSHSNPTLNPTGGAGDRRGLAQPALHEDLMEAVLSPANMKQAWRRVKSNRGAPGIDGLRIDDFPAYARDQWPAIRQSLNDGRYQPQPVRRVTIPKPDGGERALGIPTVVDRVIQQAIAQVMTPIFDPEFSESSYGFRPKRSAHGALKQVKADIQTGYRVAVDLDLAKFFDNVDHDILMARVAIRIGDKRLLALIGRYLRAGVLINDDIQPSELGTPQGGPLSPLLANILLDDLDRELEGRGHRFVRYADDLMVLVKSERAGQRVKASLTTYLGRQLKLPVNEKKSQVVKIDQCVFLGFTFKRGKLRWSDAAFADFKHRIRELTGRSWGVSMQYRFDKLGQYLRGWMGYFGISEYYRPIPELDEWLRRRVRMCYWKQWRLTRTKIGHLLALGVGKRTAILTGVSSKSYWHLSRSRATQVGMTNDWLKAQGLASIRDLWMKAHGYA